MAKKIVKRAAAPMRYNDAIRVDEEPIKNSEALITSGAVAEATWFTGLKPTELDFSEWDNGDFVETLDGDYINAFTIEFDGSGKPIKFTDASGHETVVVWS